MSTRGQSSEQRLTEEFPNHNWLERKLLDPASKTPPETTTKTLEEDDSMAQGHAMEEATGVVCNEADSVTGKEEVEDKEEKVEVRPSSPDPPLPSNPPESTATGDQGKEV